MKTFEQLIKEGNEGYKFRDVIDNLSDDEIIECANKWAKQVAEDVRDEIIYQAERGVTPISLKQIDINQFIK